MRRHAFGIAVVLLLATAFVTQAAGPPTPPVKPGLWQVKMTSLDANGNVMPSPQEAAMARMTPEARARMVEMMKARGAGMPDANGAMQICMTKEMFDSGQWQQAAAQAGCTTNYLTTSRSLWKWHTTCTTFKAESDGEVAFASAESYRTKVTTTATVMGKTNTTTRLLESKWLGADYGAVKPIGVNAPIK